MSCGDRVQCDDKMGCRFEVGECGAEDCEALVAMYDAFRPLAESQGLPPAHKDDRRRWVEKLLEGGRNFVAWKDGKVVGHSALIPDFNVKDGEYIIFVSREFRSKGFGHALTTFALDVARSLGLRRVWLTVESYNFKAIKLYRRTGFMFADTGGRERTMILKL